MTVQSKYSLFYSLAIHIVGESDALDKLKSAMSSKQAFSKQYLVSISLFAHYVSTA
jgi:hypothetical protein